MLVDHDGRGRLVQALRESFNESLMSIIMVPSKWQKHLLSSNTDPTSQRILRRDTVSFILKLQLWLNYRSGGCGEDDSIATSSRGSKCPMRFYSTIAAQPGGAQLSIEIYSMGISSYWHHASLQRKKVTKHALMRLFHARLYRRRLDRKDSNSILLRIRYGGILRRKQLFKRDAKHVDNHSHYAASCMHSGQAE